MKTAAIFLSIFTLLFSTAFSQSDCASKDSEHHMWGNLELSAEQKESLKTLHTEMSEVRKKNFEAVSAVRTKIKDELLKDQPSKSILDGYAAELGNLHKDISVERTSHLLSVKQILTPEQFTKLVSKEWCKGPGKFRGKGNSDSCKHAAGCKGKKGPAISE